MEAGTKTLLGWAELILGILVILMPFLGLGTWFTYLVGAIVAIGGLWMLLK